MATRDEWNRLINLTHELALVEYDLRILAETGNQRASVAAQTILFERF